MPYTNLIFFALSLIIYATYIPDNKGNFISFLLSFSTLIVGYYLFTWITYRYFRRKIEKGYCNVIRVIHIIGALEKKFILFALFLYLYLVYTAGLKNIIWRFSLLKASVFLDLTTGLFPFLLFLMILWSNSFIRCS